jgi:hypothetical protein
MTHAASSKGHQRAPGFKKEQTFTYMSYKSDLICFFMLFQHFFYLTSKSVRALQRDKTYYTTIYLFSLFFLKKI